MEIDTSKAYKTIEKHLKSMEIKCHISSGNNQQRYRNIPFCIVLQYHDTVIYYMHRDELQHMWETQEFKKITPLDEEER